MHTQEDVVSYTAGGSRPPRARSLTSAFGPFVGVPVRQHTYNDVLPSANLKIDLTPDLVARFAAVGDHDARRLLGAGGLHQPDASGRALGQNVGGGSGGNPDLKPIRSTNLDAGLEWYFAKRSLLSATAFYMDLRNYVGYGSEIKTYVTYSSHIPDRLPTCPTT